jgi:hypothetical protein
LATTALSEVSSQFPAQSVPTEQLSTKLYVAIVLQLKQASTLTSLELLRLLRPDRNVNLDSTVNWDLSLNIRKLVSLVHSQMLKARALVIHAQLATTALELFQSL